MKKTQNWQNKTRDSYNNKGYQKKHERVQREKSQGTKIVVWNNDVNGALKKLKKVLERADRQKELSRREFFEKPCQKRKRAKSQAVKRERKREDTQIMNGEWMPHIDTSNKAMKGKRQRRKAFMQKERLRKLSGRR
mgnify:CR=1 FL=1